MDATAKLPPETVGVPFVFTGYEIEECYDRRGKFRLGELRRRQEEKGLQIILLYYHGIATKWPDETRNYVTPLDFSVVKARRVLRVFYFMTIKYRYEGTAWQHVFRYERNTNGGTSVSGRLYTISRRPMVVK